MLPYLFSWGLFAGVAIINPLRRLAGSGLLWVALFLVVLIGLREQVGGDWGNYLPYLDSIGPLSLLEALQETEPGYALLNWLGARSGGGVYLVNTICGALFTFGLLRFCRAQPRPWLALTLAVPYLITVVAMGYSRQGVAIGFEMLALLALQRDRLPVLSCPALAIPAIAPPRARRARQEKGAGRVPALAFETPHLA